MYAVKFFKGTKERVVVVDDYFPCKADTGQPRAGRAAALRRAARARLTARGQCSPRHASRTSCGSPLWRRRTPSFTRYGPADICCARAGSRGEQSYEALDSGWVDQALCDLTNGVGSRIQFKGEVLNRIRNGSLWYRAAAGAGPALRPHGGAGRRKELLDFYESGYKLGAGSPAGSDTETSALGIVKGARQQRCIPACGKDRPT